MVVALRKVATLRASSRISLMGCAASHRGALSAKAGQNCHATLVAWQTQTNRNRRLGKAIGLASCASHIAKSSLVPA
jgi:hypothetical protein